MSHLHFPDGILPVWLWLGGLVVIAIILAIILYRLSSRKATKKVALVGALAAMMLVGMSFEIFAYHVNLAIPVGIILGPGLGFLAAFVTNFFLALVGHGGITVVGLNTITLGFETVFGWLLFTKIIRLKNIFARTFLASIITLALSTTMAVAIIWYAAPSHLADEIPQEASAIRIWLGFSESAPQEPRSQPNLAIIYSISFVGWLIESAISAVLVSYLAKVKPGSIPL